MVHRIYRVHALLIIASAIEKRSLMKTRTIFTALVTVFIVYAEVFSTPSTEFWTAGTSDIQPFGVVHFGLDNYFTVFRKVSDGAGNLPMDPGITVGVLPFSKVQMEIGLDLMEPLDFPILANAKLGIPENGFFSGQPAVAAGIFNVVMKKSVSDYIAFAALGKTLPLIGRVFIGGYLGDKATLSGETNKGLTFAWDRGFWTAKSCSGADYSKLLLCADWASGKNYYGGGGPAVGYYFNENLSLLTGPVFFNDEALNGKWKWSIQFDANIKAW
jgi:hypothetical protein